MASASRFGKIQLPEFLDNTFRVVWQEMDVVADEEGGRGEAGHDFYVEATLAVVEEDIVAVASLVEIVHDIVHGNLDEIGKGIEIRIGSGHDIQFPEAHAGTGGDVEGDTVSFSAGQAVELSLGKEKIRVQMGKANELHMGMADGSSGQGAEILEEEDGLVFPGIDHALPMVDSEADETVHVFCCIVRHVGLAGMPLDDDELVSPLYDIVFVPEKDDIAVGIDDVRELVGIAEGTGSFLVDDVFRFLASKSHIEANQVDIHEEPPS